CAGSLRSHQARPNVSATSRSGAPSQMSSHACARFPAEAKPLTSANSSAGKLSARSSSSGVQLVSSAMKRRYEGWKASIRSRRREAAPSSPRAGASVPLTAVILLGATYYLDAPAQPSLDSSTKWQNGETARRTGDVWKAEAEAS